LDIDIKSFGLDDQHIVDWLAGGQRFV
jgi:hypothetical protein